MATITIEITDSEFKALEYIAADPNNWIRQLVQHRASLATNDIVSLVTEHCLDNSISIPGTREAMITFAYDNNLIQPARAENAVPE